MKFVVLFQMCSQDLPSGVDKAENRMFLCTQLCTAF
jgi:hypothetical protein